MAEDSILSRLAAEKREEWLVLLTEQQNLEMRLRQLREYVQRLNPLLELEGVEPIPLTLGASSKGKGFAAVGNKSRDMPLRKAEFADKRLHEAVTALLTASQRSMHADELVKLIYEVTSRKDLARGKHTLVGTLATGVKERRWHRVGPNRYALEEEVTHIGSGTRVSAD